MKQKARSLPPNHSAKKAGEFPLPVYTMTAPAPVSVTPVTTAALPHTPSNSTLMSKKMLFLLTTVFTLLAGGFYMTYRGVQLYHEWTRPQTPASTSAALAQPGKQVTTFSFIVSREVVAPPVPASFPHRPPRHRK